MLSHRFTPRVWSAVALKEAPMPEELKGGWDGQERRSDTDRRSGEDRRKENRGIRNAPFFRLFLNRRSRKDRRSGQDQRKAEPTVE